MRVRVWYDQGGADVGTPWAMQWGNSPAKLHKELAFTRAVLKSETFRLRFDRDASPKGWLELDLDPAPFGVSELA